LKLTNRFNLPQPIVDAVLNDGYSKGGADYSVTELLSPPRQATLKRQHESTLEEDASERIWSLLGQSIHTILERANKTGIAERRLTIEIEGKTISGGMDLVCAARTLSDYKVTTAYKFKGGKAPLDFEQQLNSYAAILRANGESIEKLQIVGILRDWSKLEAARDADYPQSQVVIIEVPMWPADQAIGFLRDRLILHMQAQVTLPLCTMEERWAKPDVWAVKKKGAARATKLHQSEREAKAHAALDSSLEIEYRRGENTRCQHYCSVARYCNQFQSFQDADRASWEQPLNLGQVKSG
jgi:hypothetical protein